jgi:multiple sugar transport system ATP-binding protein
MMDEPLGALDAEFRHLMCTDLRELHDRLGATTVYVTHDQLEAMSMADTIAVMNEGRVEQLGSPRQIYDHPISMFVADFIGSPPMNFLRFEDSVAPGDVAVMIDGARIVIPALREGANTGALVLGARPEHIRLSDEGTMRGEIFGAEYLGTTQIVTVRTSRGMLKARIPSSMALQPGENVGLSFDAERLSLFNGETGRVFASALHDTRPQGGHHG